MENVHSEASERKSHRQQWLTTCCSIAPGGRQQLNQGRSFRYMGSRQSASALMEGDSKLLVRLPLIDTES